MALHSASHFDGESFDRQIEENVRSASVILPLLFEHFRPRSIVDVGCGAGAWLKCAQELGVRDTFGVDGESLDRGRLRIDSARFQCVDLRKRFDLGRHFDLAISVKAAERLPYQRSETFIADLVALSDVVLFSAALPFQGGVNHINEQWLEFWAILIRRHDYVACDVLRPHLLTRLDVDSNYAQNLIVFCRRGRAAKLFSREVIAEGRSLSLPHPLIFLANVARYRPLAAEALADEYEDYLTLLKAYLAGDTVPPPLRAMGAVSQQSGTALFPAARTVIEDVRATLNGKDEEITRLSRALAAQEDERGRVIAELVAGTKSARRVMDDLKARNEERERLAADLARIEGQLAALEAENRHLTADLISRTVAGGRLSAELAARNEQVQRQDSELRRLSEELTAREPAVQRLTADLAGQATELERLAKELSARGQEATLQQCELERLSEDLTARESRIARLAADLARHTEERERLATELEAHRREATFQQGELARLSGQLSSRESEVARLAADLALQAEERERLATELESREQEATLQRDELARLSGELSSRESEVVRLAANLARQAEERERLATELEARKQEATFQQGELARLSGELSSRESEVARLAAELGSKSEENGRIAAELAASKLEEARRNEGMRRLTAHLAAANKSWAGRLQASLAQVEQLGRELSREQARIHSLESQVAEGSRQLEAREYEHNCLAANLEESRHAALALRQSWSWRLTAPLRAAVDLALWIQRIFRGSERDIALRTKLLGLLQWFWYRGQIRASGLFNERYYLDRYPDVAQARRDPLRHFFVFGAAEGRSPHPLFDLKYYFGRNPDIAESSINPLVHFLKWGAFEGRNPHPAFDTKFYVDSYPEVLRMKQNPLAHYLGPGASQGLDPNPWFDTSEYLENHPHAARMGLNPLIHYLEQRDAELRRESARMEN